MARYFFTVADGRVFTDDFGVEFSSLSDARSHAIETVSSMLRDDAFRRWQGSEWRIIVTNEAGGTVLRLRFSAEAIEPIGGRLAEIPENTKFDRGQIDGGEEETLLNLFGLIQNPEARLKALDFLRTSIDEEDADPIPRPYRLTELPR